MEQLTLKSLHDPRHIVRIFHLKRQLWIEPSADQRFQEYPGSVELWQTLADGRLLRVQRWLKRSICVETAEETQEAGQS